MKNRVKKIVLLLWLLVLTPVPLLCSIGGTPAANAQSVLFIRVNQLGFRPDDVKTAVAFGSEALPPTFRVLDAKTGAVALEAKAVPANAKWGEFAYHAELNFSELRTEGKYVLELGATRSPEFAIAGNVNGDLGDQLLEFMRQQRCGYNPYVDAVCHAFDGRTAYGPLPPGTYLNASGGWHDAGDQLKYLLTAGNATAQMLLAYQLATGSPRQPAQSPRQPAGSSHQPADSSRQPVQSPRTRIVFADRFNALGQPGANGIADVLDEARWGLDWMLRLHPAKDQLYHQVADDRDHKGFRLPQNETVDYGWGAGSYRVVYFADGRPQGLKQFQSQSNGVANLAGRYAAAMALGYQIWKDDPQLRSFASQLLQAGREIYELGRAHEGVQQGNSYGAPYRYAETTWADDMEWGAAELFRATRDVRYLRDAKRYALLAAAESWMGKQETGHYQFYPFLNLGHFRLYELVDARMKQQLAGFYREGIERTVAQGKTNPYQIGVPFIWCSNNLTVALVTQGALYERMTGDHRYRDFTAKQFDWLLGRNPWGVSMFTGIPANGTYPRDVHLFPNALLKQMVRGGLIDGPVYRKVFASLRGLFIREPDPFAAFQDERAVYHDDINDYSTNEPTMDGTASAILMLAAKN